MMAAAVPCVHPLPDNVFIRISKGEIFTGEDAKFPAFVNQVESWWDKVGSLYVTTTDPLTRQAQINVLGIPPQQVQIDQGLFYNYLIALTGNYASATITSVQRGIPDCGTNLWLALYNGHQQATAQDRVTRKQDLTQYAEYSFSHEHFDTYFDQLIRMHTIIDNNTAVNLRVDEEALTTSVLAGIKRDQRYAVVVETIRYERTTETVDANEDDELARALEEDDERETLCFYCEQ
eukprot:706180-Rhodomonas_salina.1